MLVRIIIIIILLLTAKTRENNFLKRANTTYSYSTGLGVRVIPPDL